MKKSFVLAALTLCFAAEMAVLLLFTVQGVSSRQDAVAVNEVFHAVQNDWGNMESHCNQTALDYVVLDMEGEVLFRTKSGLSESVNQAVIHRDTILDVYDSGIAEGKLLIYNDTEELLLSGKRTAFLCLEIFMIVQMGVCAWYIAYLERSVLRPFQKMKDFARRVAGGNLDIPLEMDRHNLFGAFTESFDIMRTELKKARKAEAEANIAKKELVAKLSHDIKTPVASIKAVSEVGLAVAANEKDRANYTQIIGKADQINTLVTNLFTATLEELQQLAVAPANIESGRIGTMLENADYLHRATIQGIPECLVYADSLRLQQVFDNIFANSYKYAKTEINVTARKTETSVDVVIEDFGGGVLEEELLVIKEKFKRGSNSANTEGAGLGLYISDYFMKEMGGGLNVENGAHGLKVTVTLRLSGK